MKNPKTTWGGVALIVSGVANALYQYFTGHPIDINILTSLLGTISGGIALIHASDGTP